ncbi:Class II abasic (AP) endonuclease [Sporothrix stenoceras]
MTVRIVTWNVNGIRNPLKYSPWNKDRSLKVQFHEDEQARARSSETRDKRNADADGVLSVQSSFGMASYPR